MNPNTLLNPALGPPLILASDWFIDAARDWKEQLEVFGDRYDCRPFTLGEYFDRLAEARDKPLDFDYLRLREVTRSLMEPARILAHGLSAVPALRLAHEEPERVAGLVLVNPLIGVDYHLGGIEAWHRSRLRTWLRLRFYDPLGEGVAAHRRPGNWSVARASAYARNLKDNDPREWTVGTRIPVAIIVGDADPVVSPACGENLNAELPHSRLIRFANLGHNPQREEPEHINPILEEILYVRAEGLRRAWRRFTNLFQFHRREPHAK